jgi:hypothetical protein
MTTPKEETRTVDIKGRKVEVHQLTDMQLMFMAREARKLQKMKPDADNGDTILSIGRVLDVLESAVVKQDDKDYLLDLTIAGNLKLNDMMQVLTVFSDNGEEEKPKVRRGRPPRSATKV